MTMTNGTEFVFLRTILDSEDQLPLPEYQLIRREDPVVEDSSEYELHAKKALAERGFEVEVVTEIREYAPYEMVEAYIPEVKDLLQKAEEDVATYTVAVQALTEILDNHPDKEDLDVSESGTGVDADGASGTPTETPVDESAEAAS